MKPIVSFFAIAVMICVAVLQTPPATVAAAAQSRVVDLPSIQPLPIQVDDVPAPVGPAECTCENCNCSIPVSVATEDAAPVQMMQVCDPITGTCSMVPVSSDGVVMSDGMASSVSACEDCGPVRRVVSRIRERQPVRSLIGRLRRR